jgi:hypothetical protein
VPEADSPETVPPTENIAGGGEDDVDVVDVVGPDVVDVVDVAAAADVVDVVDGAEVVVVDVVDGDVDAWDIDAGTVWIVNVLGVLMTLLPAWSDCSATAVYAPSEIGLAVTTDHLSPERIVLSVRTGEPVACVPEKTLTVIVDESVAALPPVPENAGVSSLVVVALAGLRKVTFGGTASTVQTT